MPKHKPALMWNPESEIWTWYPSRAIKGLRVSILNEQGEMLEGVTRVEYGADEVIGFNDRTGEKLIAKLPFTLNT